MRCRSASTGVILLAFNIVVGIISSSAAEISKGGFGAARPGTGPSAPSINSPATKSTSRGKRDSYPYHGYVEKIESGAITLKGKEKGRVIILSRQTNVWKGKQKGTINDIVPGARVTGTVRKNSEGREEALTLRYGGDK